MTTRFTYKVTVTVPDEVQTVYHHDIWQNLGPESMTGIVMMERLSFEEDYGFDYSVEWERTDG